MPRAPLIASAFALLLLSFPAQQSCRSTAQSSHIPNRISPVEYKVYSAWLAALEPDLGVNSYPAVRTIVFSRRRCEKLVTAALGPHAAVLNQFDELGDAQCGLDFCSTPRKLKMPWPMQPAPEPPADGPLSPYRVIFTNGLPVDCVTPTV